ncbi:MAG TPA: DUF2934 domain-containing protein [Blastocatellia bacterium]|nr:DUF2934 domain-containing protein [Blastocatellia bacterium]
MQPKTKSEELHQEMPETQADLGERIRQRAYELSQQRGAEEGDELSDWYQAESEIRATFGPAEFSEEGRQRAQSEPRDAGQGT